MTDGYAERTIREILDHSEFIYEERQYKIIQNAKPSPETKTDFYILAVDLENQTPKEFKISYKKPTYTFIENKIKPERIRIIYGENWLEILEEQILQQNTIEENIHWKKRRPEISLQTSFDTFPVIDFRKKKIFLGSRYEIEQLDAPNTARRLHSGKIEQDITPQIFWGENCRDNMRDALVDGNIIPESGIPDFIAIIDPDDVSNANDLFDNIQNIRTYANNHNEMRAGYLAQYFRWSNKDSFWKTEEWSRVFAVWIQWSVVNGRIKGQPIFNRPFARTARQVFQTFCDCLNDLNITAPADHDTNFDIETLRGYLTDDTESVG